VGEPPHLVLASASPRRREILSALGISFETFTPDIEELTEGDPEEVVLENARRKAHAGFAAAPDGAAALGVDTEVVLGGRMLGKASDLSEARERLEALSGRTHTVLSGVVVLGPGRAGDAPAERSGVARSEVTFRPLAPDTLRAYLASGEWRDRAGAYAIQGMGSMLIDRVDGDFSNVVGLPVRMLLALVPEFFDFESETVTHANP
jgi:septum formation protein